MDGRTRTYTSHPFSSIGRSPHKLHGYRVIAGNMREMNVGHERLAVCRNGLADGFTEYVWPLVTDNLISTILPLRGAIAPNEALY